MAVRARLRRRTVLAAAVGTVGLGGAAHAWAQPDPVELTVVDRETGQAMTPWRHDGRLFVAGAPGARYGLMVTNTTPGRVLVVMSVDGVNILSGETAGYGQRGYVLDPWRSYVINGWRKSNTEIAAFSFAPLPQSYAARTGRPGDVGVIGVAVFTERVPEPPPVVPAPPLVAPPAPPVVRERAGADDARQYAQPPPPPVAVHETPLPPVNIPGPPPLPAPAASAGLVGAPATVTAQRRTEKLGTTHGEREWSVVHDTSFIRATAHPVSVLQIEYDSFDNLVTAGVIPPSAYGEHRPRPFPRDPGGAGFVPDPPGGR